MSGSPPDQVMHVASRLIARALDRARTDWLAGDPDAWARYTAGLARLEQHYQQLGTLSRQYRRDPRRDERLAGNRRAAG